MRAWWLLLALAAGPGADPYQAGTEAFERGELDVAAEALGRAAAADKRHALARLKLAVLEFNRGHPAEARQWAEQVVAIDRRAPAATQARRLLEQVTALELLGASDRAAQAQRYDATLEALRAAAERGDLAAVVRLTAEGQAIDAGRWEAPALGGAALLRGGRYHQAQGLLETAVTKAPAGRSARLKEALELCQREVAYRDALTQGRTALSQGDYATAGTALSRAEALHPEVDEGVEEAILALQASDRVSEASALASRHPRLAPQLRAQIHGLAQLEAATRAGEVAVPPGPQLTPLSDALAPMEREYQAALADQRRAEEEADQRHQRLQAEVARLQREVDSAEREAESEQSLAAQADQSAATLENQASQLASQQGGAVAAGIARGSAAAFRIGARAAREKSSQARASAARLRQELEEARAQDPGE